MRGEGFHGRPRRAELASLQTVDGGAERRLAPLHFVGLPCVMAAQFRQNGEPAFGAKVLPGPQGFASGRDENGVGLAVTWTFPKISITPCRSTVGALSRPTCEAAGHANKSKRRLHRHRGPGVLTGFRCATVTIQTGFGSNT